MRQRVTAQRALSPIPSLEYRAVTGAGVRGPVGDMPLLSKEVNHCRRFDALDRRGAHPLALVIEYTPQRRTFLTPSDTTLLPSTAPLVLKPRPDRLPSNRIRRRDGWVVVATARVVSFLRATGTESTSDVRKKLNSFAGCAVSATPSSPVRTSDPARPWWPSRHHLMGGAGFLAASAGARTQRKRAAWGGARTTSTSICGIGPSSS